MYVIALALFVAVVAIIPNLLDRYDQWIKEAATPNIFKDAPYFPMWFLIALGIAVTVFFIYASVREYHIQKEKK